MLQIKIGLVDKTGKIDPSKLVRAAASLNIQVSRDLPKFWTISAAVAYLPDASKIPQGYWPVFLVDRLPPGEGGFHLTRHNQPYAKVVASPDSDEWTIDASHEVVEMLVDPSGNKLQTANAIEIVGGKIRDGSGKFEYLVEACDPCEADACGYQIDGVLVSDFLTPNFYDRIAATDARYSFTGAVKYPRNILPGGYITWIDPETQQVQQLRYIDPDAPPSIVTLGPANGASLRSFVDAATLRVVSAAKAKTASSKKVSAARLLRLSSLDRAAQARAKVYL